MSESLTLPPDPLSALAATDVQRQAARLAQEAFATTFRLSLAGAAEQRQTAVARIKACLAEWAGMASQEESRLRRVLLLAGLDQWGLAYSPLFGAGALRGLTELIAELRGTFAPEDREAVHAEVVLLHTEEAAAFEFKVEVRRALHLALWHSMIASDARDDATEILRQLGSLMVSLVAEMPTLGWRIVADALATIQVQCLTKGLAAEGLAREMTTELFAALARELPADVGELALAHAAQAVRDWQQAQRATHH